MAIVKFISEKDYQIFIDKESVGLVTSDQILKVTLEAGSYYIEAKDAEGRIVCKYELLIKSDDNQLLQNITEKVNNISNTIDELRNNSSIRFYHNRAIFKHNNCYGYINSQYKVAIQPIYSYADEFFNEKALVKKLFPEGEKATIIDVEGNLCLEQWYDFIGSSDRTILFRSGASFYVIDRTDYTVIKKYKDAGYNNKGELIPVIQDIGVDTFYGYIDRNGIEVIPFIYDYAWNFEDNGFAKVMRFGSVHAVDKEGTLFFNLTQAEKDGKTFTRRRNYFDAPGDTPIEEVFKAKKLSKEESIIKGFSGNYGDGEYWEEYPIKENGKWGLGSYESIGDENHVDKDGNYLVWKQVDTNKIAKYDCDRILFYADGYFAYRKGRFCKLISIDEPDFEYSFLADEIIPNIQWQHTYNGSYDTKVINNLIIKFHGKYGIISLDGKIILSTQYDLITTSEAMDKDTTGNVGIIWNGGKCTLVRMADGKIFEPFRYEDIIVNKVNSNNWLMSSTYLVKEKGKYGCISFNGDPILEPIYDSIDFKLEEDVYGYHYKMMLYKDGKVGTYEYCNHRDSFAGAPVIELEFTVSPEYDECVFLRNKNSVANFIGMSYVAVRKGEKWGIIDNTPASSTYSPIDETHWYDKANLVDLRFAYNSLQELKDDADAEFARRYTKYSRPHMVLEWGSHLMVSEEPNNEE